MSQKHFKVCKSLQSHYFVFKARRSLARMLSGGSVRQTIPVPRSNDRGTLTDIEIPLQNPYNRGKAKGV